MSSTKLSKKDAPKAPSSIEKNLSESDFIVSKTDTKGNIIYCNEIFIEMAGYNALDLIGANHNLIRHPDMPRLAFKVAWELIQEKKEFFGFVKNLSKDASYYWVFAYMTADLDENGNIVSYTSIRRKPTPSAIDAITQLYKLLLDAEKSGGMDASARLLDEILKEKNISYEEYIINLQKGASL